MSRLAREFRRIAKKSRGCLEVGDLKEIVRVRKQSRIRTTVLDQIREDAILVQGRQELSLGVQELERRIDWLRGNRRARAEARNILRRRAMSTRLDAIESFLVVSTALLVLLFVSVHVVRAVSISVLPELYLECSPTGHPHLHYTSAPLATEDSNCSAYHAYEESENACPFKEFKSSPVVESSPPSWLPERPVTGLRLRWMLIRGHHPCIPIYMECFTLPEPIVHPYQGQY